MTLGCLSYINTLPITLGLELGQVEFAGELVHGPPSRLNALTRQGLLDLTAISSIEVPSCAQHYRLVRGFALSSPGAVQSVKLFSQVPFSELAGQPVACTSASATSRALLQILLPQVEVVDQADPTLAPAYLLIGDQALLAAPAPYELDLGQAWLERTGYPMVFACWLTRRQPQENAGVLGGAEELLERSRRWSLEHWDLVLQESQRRTGLPLPQLQRYFAGLRYELGQRELESLKLLYQLASKRGLLQAPADFLEEIIPCA